MVVDVGDGRWGGSPENPVFVSSYPLPTGATHAVFPHISESTGRHYVFVGDEIMSRRGLAWEGPGRGARLLPAPLRSRDRHARHPAGDPGLHPGDGCSVCPGTSLLRAVGSRRSGNSGSGPAPPAVPAVPVPCARPPSWSGLRATLTVGAACPAGAATTPPLTLRYVVKPADKNACGPSSDPVARLHHEHVVAGLAEQRPQVVAEREGAGLGEVVPALRPDREQHRSGPVFPAQDRVGAELPEVEVGVGEASRGSRRRRCRR